MQSLRLRRLPRAVVRGLAALIAAAFAGHVLGQGAASSPAPSERVQRDADSVYRWIMIHADKPKKTREEPKPATPAAAPMKPAPRTAKTEAASDKAKAPAVPGSAAPVGIEPAVAAAMPPAASAPAPAASAPDSQLASIAPPATALSQAAPEPDDDDAPLVLLRQVDPEFPAATMRRLHKGAVRVKFEVRADGSVDRAEVLKTSHASLNTAATDAVTKWKFQPLRRAQSGIVDLQFDLE